MLDTYAYSAIVIVVSLLVYIWVAMKVGTARAKYNVHAPSVDGPVEFQRVFREYGLPAVLRTDNGVPFAQSNAMGHLGALSYWWIRLGIMPQRILPAHPEQNGAHERMHKTLKRGAMSPNTQMRPPTNTSKAATR